MAPLPAHRVKTAVPPKSARVASKKETEDSFQEASDILKDAIKTLFSKPKSERNRHLALLAAELSDLATRVGTAKEVDQAQRTADAARRIQAARRVIAILQKASDSRS